MVTHVSQWGRSGLSYWIAQRISAVVLVLYMLCILGFLLTHPDLQYTQWKAYFSSTWMRIWSLAALLSVAVHGWIGLWAVSTDYFTERLLGPKGNVLRFLFQVASVAVLFTYLVWGVQVIWS